MNMSAATIRRTLSRYGAQDLHFATMFGAVILGV
jgi:hypothetical protein